ncbi:MAG: T9SS type A sorting domain-containing protein [Taibaiella sp.]|nr:T9SS type A sorting domain-containing protein [Taibaiella sp.]
MKKIVLFLSSILVMAAASVSAQSFTTEFDTVSGTITGNEKLYNKITNTTAGSIPISWKVTSHNFPLDWQTNTGICDISLCYTGTSIFSGSSYSSSYPPGQSTFYLLIDMPLTTSAGTFYVNVQISTTLETPVIETFIVTKGTTSVSVVKAPNSVAIYPNPVTNELNVDYKKSDNVKSISMRDITGKVINNYAVNATDTHTGINVEMLPAGLYFLHMLNADSEVITIKKFVKQ